jgi:hypothetical protein
MKTGLKTKWGLFWVIVLVFFTGQVVRAERSWVCELTVTGEICAIIAKNNEEEVPSAIVVSDDCDSDTSPDTINGIPFDKLDKYLEEERALSPLAEGDWIAIQAHVCPAEEGQLKACEILEINGEVINFTLSKGNEKSKKKDK